MFSIGPWQWTADAPGGVGNYWSAPPGAVPVIDLRSVPMSAAPGPVAQGFGIFRSPIVLGDPYVALGDDPDRILTTAQRDEWRRALGLAALDAQTLKGAIWETLTVRADPSGDAGVPPLMADHLGRLELHSGGRWLSKRLRMIDPEWNAVRARLHLDYRRIREGALTGIIAPEHHRKLLTVWMRKFRTDDHRVFIPPDLPDEQPLAPSTTITESFNTADSDILGPDLSWTELEGDIDVVSNQAKVITLGLARADSDLASDDHYSQIVLVNASTAGKGTIARKDSTATLTLYRVDTINNTWRSFRRVNGTYTAIGTNTTFLTQVANDIIKIEVNGSTVKRFRNGSEQDSATDTNITGNLRCGFGFAVNTIFDSFEAADLAAGATVTPDPVLDAITVADPAATPGAVTLAPAAALDAITVADPTVTSGATVSPDPVLDAIVAAAPSVTAGPATLSPPALADAIVVTDPALGPGAVTLTPAALADAIVVTVPGAGAGPVTLAPNALLAALIAAAPTVAPGAVSATPDSLVAALVVVDPTVGDAAQVPGATFAVPAETRTFGVDADSATFTVPAEDRTFEVT